MNKLDFIILCEKRTGSHLLSTLLSSHPDINCQFRELAMLNRSVVLPTKGKIKGGIIHYQEADRARTLIDPDKIIHLVRDMESVHRSYLATFYTRESIGHFCREDYRQPLNPTLDLDNKTKVLVWNELSKRRKKAFGYFHRPILTVSYGMLTEGKDVEEIDNKTTQAILKFLGASPRPLTTRLKKGISSHAEN